MFDKWRTLSVNHSLSIIIFSRYFLDDSEISTEQLLDSHDDLYAIHSLRDGRRYIDYYKVIHWNEIRQTPSQGVLARLRREFLQFPAIMEDIAKRTKITLRNSIAADGNFLEVVNLVLNAYDKYYVNRDLTRTGQEIVMVSPGVGVVALRYNGAEEAPDRPKFIIMFSDDVRKRSFSTTSNVVKI
jgi:hypothetical protein